MRASFHLTARPFAAIWPVLVLAGAALAAYHNSFQGPFVFDDASSIVTNPTIRRLWPLTEPLSPPTANVTAQGRPVLNLSLALNYAAGGTAVGGYHALNLIVHTLAGLTLFGLVRRTLVSGLGRPAAAATWPALTVAVLWTVHPLQTEAVTYVIQRAESLMGLFYLLTFYCFVRGVERERGAGWLALAVCAGAAGMATKEVMATAPLMVLFFDRTFYAGSFRAAWQRRRGFYATLGGTWCLLGWLVLQGGGNRGGSVGFGVGVAWWDYWLTQCRAIPYYLRLAFWPHPLVFEYGTFWIGRFAEVAAGAAVAFALLAGTLAGLWRWPAVGFLGAWFLGILAPTSLAPGTTQMIVEHRVYLPLAAVLVAVVLGLRPLLRPRWAVAAGVVAAAGLTLLTVRRNADYRSDVVLWSDTIAKRPANPLAHTMLAGAWERAGAPERAEAAYLEALRLKPDFSAGHEHLGELLLRQGRPGEAIAHFEAALRLQPEFPDAHMNLGNALLAQGRVAEAVAHLATAVRLAPGFAEMHYNLGHALAAAGREAEAQAEFAATLSFVPGNPAVHVAAHRRLANRLAQTGRPAEAIPHYAAVLRASPEDVEAHHNLGGALFEVGRWEEAASHYETAVRLAPDFAPARENLARVRARQRE